MLTYNKQYHPSVNSVAVTTGKIFFQPKLTINNPNDKYEQEADAVSDKVMRMEPPFIQAKQLLVSSVQKKCAHCGEEEKQMQRKEINDGETTAGNNLESYVSNLNTGQSLPDEARNFYEPRFGYDFSNVKVHTDNVAAKSAQSINALAYTSGNNIVFNNGQYAPDTNTGKKLLGHELTHVVQQQSYKSNKPDAVMRQPKPENKFESCTTTQQSQLLPIIEDARKAVSLATSVIATSWGKPDKIAPNRKQLLMDHFHTTSRGDLRDILSKYISLEKTFATGFELKCETTCPKDKKGVVCGYAYNTQWFGGRGPIHICFDSAGCDFTTTAKNNQVALIIHEAAHRHTALMIKHIGGKQSITHKAQTMPWIMLIPMPGLQHFYKPMNFLCKTSLNR